MTPNSNKDSDGDALSKKTPWKSSIMRRLLWFLGLILLPAIGGWTFMNPVFMKSKRVPLPKDNEGLILNLNLASTPFDDFNEVLFGTPLKLKWYQVCLDNRNEVSLNNTKIQLPYEKDPETGAVETTINLEGGASYKIYAPVNETKCLNVKLDRTPLSVSVKYRRPLATSFAPIFEVKEKTEEGGTASVYKSSFIHTEKSAMTFANRPDEFLYKLLLLIIGWIIALVNLKQSWGIFDKQPRKHST